MSRNAWMASVAVVIALVGGFYWYAATQKTGITVDQVLAPPDAEVAAEQAAPPDLPTPTAVTYPLSEIQAQADPALPPLKASDTHLLAALFDAFGKTPIESLLIPDQLVRRFVATVNSLDGEPVALRQRPLRHVPGLLSVERAGDRLLLSPHNAERYTPLVNVLQGLDPQRAVDLYVRYYPLLQKAYAELGYPDRYFNDRLIQVIDHLLETRETAGPIELVRPKVLYEFADRELEKRSSGEKILIRMGPENAEIVRRQLRLYRDALIARTLKP